MPNMRYSILSTLCLIAAILRPIFIHRFIKDVIQGEGPYRSGVYLSIDGFVFILWLMEVFGRL